MGHGLVEKAEAEAKAWLIGCQSAKAKPFHLGAFESTASETQPAATVTLTLLHSSWYSSQVHQGPAVTSTKPPDNLVYCFWGKYQEQQRNSIFQNPGLDPQLLHKAWTSWPSCDTQTRAGQ